MGRTVMLVGEPDLPFSGHLTELLEAHSFAVEAISPNENANLRINSREYACVILNLKRPEAGTFDLLRRIRQKSTAPILVLTPRDTVASRLLGAAAGADDFIVKPASGTRVLRRLQAMLGQRFSPPAKVWRMADLEVDIFGRRCLRQHKPVSLAATEFELLLALIRGEGHVQSFASLHKAVWGTDLPNESNVIEVTIRRLRIKLDNPFEVRLLHTVRGVGYVLEDRSSPDFIPAFHRQPSPEPDDHTGSAAPARHPGRTLGHSSAAPTGAAPTERVRIGMNLWKRNNIWTSGDGAITMVFAHGFGCDQTMWRHVAPSFSGKFRTVLFDHVGSGNSDLSAFDFAKYQTLHGYANDLNELLDHLGGGPFIVIGHSVSAMIGMLADLDRPGRIIKQVMIGPSPCYLNDGEYVGGFERGDIAQLLKTLENDYLGWSRKMAPIIMGAPDQPALGQELTHSFCRTDPEIAKHFARATFLSDHRADLPRLKTPSLILQCDDDVIAPMTVGRYMHRQMPNSILRVVRNVGHCPHLSAPSQCLNAIDEFLNDAV